jgi:hypothetical protein
VHRPPAQTFQDHQFEGAGKKIAVFRLFLHFVDNSILDLVCQI